MTIYSKHSNTNRHSAKMTNTEYANSSELLRQCFPTIRSRDEVLTSIHVSNHLRATFEGWTPKQQEEIMNPEYTPDRLSSFLSLVLRQQERTGSYSIRYIVNIRTSKFSYPA